MRQENTDQKATLKKRRGWNIFFIIFCLAVVAFMVFGIVFPEKWLSFGNETHSTIARILFGVLTIFGILFVLKLIFDGSFFRWRIFFWFTKSSGWRLLRRIFYSSIIVVSFLCFFEPDLYVSSNSTKTSVFIWLGLEIAAAFLILLFVRSLSTRHALRIYLLSALGLIALIFLFYVEEDWRGRRLWENYKHQLEAEGEHFDFAYFVPPPVPDDQNFALTPIVAGIYLDHPNSGSSDPAKKNYLDIHIALDSDDWLTNKFWGNWKLGEKTNLKAIQNYYRSSLTNSNKSTAYDFPIPAHPQSPAADVLFALSKYDPAIEELRKASALPYSRFAYDYSIRPISYVCDNARGNYYSIGLSPYGLDSFIRCALVLQVRAIAELESGQGDLSLSDIRLSLYLAQATRNEPFMYSYLFRLRSIDLTLQPVWQGLVNHQWTDGQIIEIEKKLSEFDFVSDYQFALRASRTVSIGEIDEFDNERTSKRFIDECVSAVESKYWGDMTGSSFRYFMPKCAFYLAKYNNAKNTQRLLLTEDELKKRDFSRPIIECKKLMAQRDAEIDSWSPYRFVGYIFGFNFPRVVERIALTQVSINSARIACALERYRLAHGEYPATLDTLSPQYIEKLPHDIINGQPLHYRRTDDGHFLLYSVGWNETDDGGKVVMQKESQKYIDLEQGDWVWPSVAK